MLQSPWQPGAKVAGVWPTGAEGALQGFPSCFWIVLKIKPTTKMHRHPKPTEDCNNTTKGHQRFLDKIKNGLTPIVLRTPHKGISYDYVTDR